MHASAAVRARAAVASGAAELAFVIDEPVESERVEVEPLSDEEIAVVVGAGHPLLKSDFDPRTAQENESPRAEPGARAVQPVLG